MTNLAKYKNDWESLAEHDALWAILTDESKVGGKWDLVEFMATGEAEIETVINHLGAIGHMPDRNGAALDFGCGVGRLAQPLARRFGSVVGVDISEHMIQKAEAINRYTHCQYIVNADSKLPIPDAAFSFIYSNIALQHIPEPFSTEYLREFVRVLAPDGVLVFGVQDHSSAGPLSSMLTRARQLLRIRTRIKVALGRSPGDMQMHCLSEQVVRGALGSAKVVDIQFTRTAAKDFNGKLLYLQQAPASGYVGKQYCVVKQI